MAYSKESWYVGRPSQEFAPPLDEGLTVLFSRMLCHRSDACQTRGLLTPQCANLGAFNQDGHCGNLTNTWNRTQDVMLTGAVRTVAKHRFQFDLKGCELAFHLPQSRFDLAARKKHGLSFDSVSRRVLSQTNDMRAICNFLSLSRIRSKPTPSLRESGPIRRRWLICLQDGLSN